MEKLPVQVAQEEAIKAIKDYRVSAELWGGKNRTLVVNFAYPRIENKINEIEIGLEDVRASDGIKIHYDFERDGYVVMQPFFVDVPKKDYTERQERWEEVGFYQSWALEHKNIIKD